MRFYSFVAAAALASASLAAHADVMYTYVGAGLSAGTTFIIDSPNFLMYSSTVLAPTSGSSELFFGGEDDGPLTGVSFTSPTYLRLFSNSTNYNGFAGSYGIAADGTYTDFFGSTLIVSGSPTVTPVAATPEPSSIALLGTGLLGALGVARKRFA